ncbi:MAG: flavin reductase, partial [Ruminococcus sp.]|nr:flavin reductase [Ruminococcus sp.]
MSFKKINLSDLSFNPFSKIGKEWMLLTAGNKDSFNTMTASWGQLGVLWSRNVLTCYIRPNRYTLEFVEKSEYFTASFFGEEYRKALSYCGSHSGRDCDKVKETGLTPAEIGKTMTFAEADMVFVCRKLYTYDMQESGFVTDEGIAEQNYSSAPYHKA